MDHKDLEPSYRDKVLRTIVEHCERRGIPEEESLSFRGYIRQECGKSVMEMTNRELQKVQHTLGSLLRGYLEGKKRREGLPDKPKEHTQILRKLFED